MLDRNAYRRYLALAAVMLMVPITLCTGGLVSDTGTGTPAASGASIALADVGHMVTADYTPRSDYAFRFGHGSKNITDGSDFASVLRAFDTWVDLPDSDISYSWKTGRPSRSLGGTNGINDITWVSADHYGPDAWTDTLGFSERSIAVTVTWYYPDTGQITERDIFFNDINMDWRTDTDGISQGGFLVEHIALHEIGHIYGLVDVYNPGHSGWTSWMGSGNENLTMYAYTTWWDDDVTVSAADARAMALAHPVTGMPTPEPGSLLILAAGTLALTAARGPRRG